MVVRTSDVEKNFFTPRDYQVELLSKACKNNIIVPLGTGLGKTFIAVLLIKEYTPKLMIPWEDGGKRAIFLVDKVSLVEQHAAHIEHHTTLHVGKIHGHLNQKISVDASKFAAFISFHQAVVLTAKIFLDLIEHAFFDLSRAALIIIDECHHALGSKHPFRLIMERYEMLDADKRPRVLGLTASLINSKTTPSKLEQLLTKLENIMQSSIQTASDLVSDDLQTFCLSCSEFHPDFDVDPRKPLLEAVSRTKSVLKQLGPWCAWKVCQLFQRQLKKHSCQGFLPEKQILFLRMGYTTMRYTKRLLDDKVGSIRSFDKMLPFLPDRLAKLFDILLYFNPTNIRRLDPDFVFSGIIFVEQRYVAYVLNTLIRALSKWDSDKFGYLVSDFIIGFNSASIGSEETMSLHKRQEEVLRRFRQRHLNLLVATSVLEEGVDVRQCNVIIRFDRPADYRAYVQSRGRARKEGSSYFILVEQSDRQLCSCDMRDFMQIERMLLKRYKNVHNPSEPLYYTTSLDDIIPPYIVQSTGARVTLSSAISLVNRYCAKLPSDIFTSLVPHNTIIPETINGRRMYRAELLLPINSPVKEAVVLEKPMPSKKLAQMAVALEACKKLHERKELSDNLLPVGKDTIVLTALDDDPDEFIPNMNYKVGSARRRQLYDKRMAKALHNAMPSSGEECHIYVMEMDLIKAVTGAANPKNRRIVNPLDTEFCFGFLSNKKIPKVPSFPVFLRQGRMQANIFVAKSRLRVDMQMLELLKAFHHYLFDSVLRLVKGGLVFVPDKSPVNILIVPLRRERNAETGEVDFKLDYTYVRSVVSSIDEMPRVPTEVERQTFKFDASKFQDAVVMPWYRDRDHPSFYYVAEIIDAKPSSKFPDDKFETFNDYFIQKYDITIYDQEQPLLDVDYTSSRLNLLLPRHWPRSRNRPTEERSAENGNQSQGQILVPELVDVHPIAASLWNVIAALPTLLYRINSLLLADELRELVMCEALVGNDYSTDDNISWKPLDYPTIMDDLDTKPIYSISDLKKEHVEKKSAESDVNDSNVIVADFEIGVWDPELAKGLEDFCADKKQDENKGFEDFDMDTIGLMENGSTLRHHGDMSDDDDEDAVVLFDFMNSVQERFGKESSDIFAPREDIKSSGWDALDVVEESPPNGINMPLSVNSGNSQIDSRGLMADLSQMSWHLGGPMSHTLHSQSVASTSQIEDIATVEISEKDENWQQSAIRKPMQLYLDSLERLEDSDRTSSKSARQEECVDLIDFCDETDELFSNDSSVSVPYDLNSFNGCLLDSGVELDSIGMSSLAVTPQHLDTDYTFEESEDGEITRSSSDTELLLQTSHDNDLNILDDPSVDFEQTNRRVKFCTVITSNTAPSQKPEINAPTLNWMTFSFQEDTLSEHPNGVSPCTLLQALTLSNASDGINLERLETVGDSFLKYAVTDYLFHTNPDQHEGKLSFARSKEVSNCNLYRLGRKHNLPSLIVGSKFDPNDGWLPPCYAPTSDFKAPNTSDAEERDKLIENILEGKAMEEQQTVKVPTGWDEADANNQSRRISGGIETIEFPKNTTTNWDGEEITPLPYNMLTQQSLGDKSIADAVEALIGAHLLELGPAAALKFMKWLGLKVLTEPVKTEEPLLNYIASPTQPNLPMLELNRFWVRFQFSELENRIGYRFGNRAYLLQACTHASYYKNRITSCYQRLEFLGDAVLDYIITRFLYQHSSCYSPGVLTDLRSALVNNTIFASLAVKYNFHKHFVAICPKLHHMIEKFVCLCKEKNLSSANFNEEMYMVTGEEDIDEGEEEDVEVPKAMGDIFESIAGAIYLDSGRNLDVVWRVFYNLMKETIEECCNNPPRSPIRELLELEPERARFSKLERILETGKVRVTVDIQGKCRFIGMGRSYRIAKCTAAKRALRYLRSLKEEKERVAARV